MLTLTKIADGDIALLKRWLYTPHVKRWYHEPLEWLSEVEQRSGAFRWIHHYIAELDGRKIGFCQYYDCADSDESWDGYKQLRGTYSLDYLIGEADCLGKGLGKQLLLSLVEIIRALPDAERIIVQPERENSASRGLLRSCGFSCDESCDVFVLML